MATATCEIYRKVLGSDLSQRVGNSKVLMVGAGGIGCELLKNLVLTGFKDIEVIDLDTIDVSNLNRQFLFQKRHVGKSKAQVSRESALQFNPDANIKAHHDNIMSPDYGLDYFKQFDVVMNALDNKAARNHVNRMCLAADVPLVESGTAGYLGQATVIKKGVTECYECQPKPTQKTFPGCTIRNTPSEPIHCIVWAKHLFNQLFGEADADEEVSPDTEDPEAVGTAGEKAVQNQEKERGSGGIERASTRTWAEEIGYDPEKLFNKLFNEDIKYLLSMDKLWKKRKPPVPVDFESIRKGCDTNEKDADNGLQDQRVWSPDECAEVFSQSVDTLKKQLLTRGEDLVWDKDDPASMDFVTSAANIRAHIFSIPMKSRFDVKAMAGNIIPAIATTNAIISGLIVMQALNILSGKLDKCKTIYLNRQPNPRKKLLVPCNLVPPNPKCYVCAAKPEVTVFLNTETLTIKALEEKMLKERFGMVAPDVEIEDGKGSILISSEEGETDENLPKTLREFHVGNSARLKADDFLQNYQLILNVVHRDDLEDGVEFEVEGDLPEPKPDGPEPAASTALEERENQPVAGDTEEVMVVDEPAPSRKRKADESELQTREQQDLKSSKRARVSNVPADEDDDDIIVL
ncbi:SUMO-activating enzyme subunit 2-like [Stylophora pistillata]|uniref:SUMO-activating enzyme subunit n=1 Tax=Stylophora pistillata TaxID=50429 RepID=A0A2B4RUV6_STYPI|nr:SUMO-activating enzyme subunit 2-like [Stylophora pistillata]PFX22234.1 SUMO-activating enzyme subunit 2 [Stylophora pistillata]